MKGKSKIELTTICLLVLSSAMVKAESQQLQMVAQGVFDHMTWEIGAPEDIEVGQEFSVVFEFMTIYSTLQIVRIDVELYGNIGQGGAWDTWKDSWTNTTWSSWYLYTKIANLTAAREGTVFARINAVYDDASMVRHSVSVGRAAVTRVWNKYPQTLRWDYSSLNQSYIDLQKDYDSLESNLNSTRAMMYILVLTTLAFIGTTVFFALRKSRVKSA